MMLLVESNFVIELAALQKEVDEAELLVQCAERHELRLFVPAFALTEPFETYARWHKQRNRSSSDLETQLKQLARSRNYADLINASQTVLAVFSSSSTVQSQRLHETLVRLTRCARVLPLDEHVIERSIEAQEEFTLDAKDAVVFASVEAGLRAAEDEEDRLFITKDRSGFRSRRVVDHFKTLRCEVVPAIGPALGRMQQAGVGEGVRPA